MLTGKFKFAPARQVKNKNLASQQEIVTSIGRPLEKIIQKAIFILLSVIYEPKFLNVSHGFRLNKSTHSALDLLHLRGGPYPWVIQGNIKDSFDTISHTIIMECLKKDISCVRTLSLIERALKAGYINTEKLLVRSKNGIRPENILYPILTNIVLHNLDMFIENQLKSSYYQGDKRRPNPEYEHYANLRRTSRAHFTLPEQRKDALKMLRKLPSRDLYDPNYKRLYYLRHNNDFIILVVGSLKDVITLKEKIDNFLSKHVNEDGFE